MSVELAVVVGLVSVLFVFAFGFILFNVFFPNKDFLEWRLLWGGIIWLLVFSVWVVLYDFSFDNGFSIQALFFGLIVLQGVSTLVGVPYLIWQNFDKAVELWESGWSR